MVAASTLKHATDTPPSTVVFNGTAQASMVYNRSRTPKRPKASSVRWEYIYLYTIVAFRLKQNTTTRAHTHNPDYGRIKKVRKKRAAVYSVSQNSHTIHTNTRDEWIVKPGSYPPNAKQTSGAVGPRHRTMGTLSASFQGESLGKKTKTKTNNEAHSVVLFWVHHEISHAPCPVHRSASRYSSLGLGLSLELGIGSGLRLRVGLRLGQRTTSALWFSRFFVLRKIPTLVEDAFQFPRRNEHVEAGSMYDDGIGEGHLDISQSVLVYTPTYTGLHIQQRRTSYFAVKLDEGVMLWWEYLTPVYLKNITLSCHRGGATRGCVGKGGLHELNNFFSSTEPYDWTHFRLHIYTHT